MWWWAGGWWGEGWKGWTLDTVSLRLSVLVWAAASSLTVHRSRPTHFTYPPVPTLLSLESMDIPRPCIDCSAYAADTPHSSPLVLTYPCL